MGGKKLDLNDCVSLIEQMNNYMLNIAEEREAGIRYFNEKLDVILNTAVDEKIQAAGITPQLMEMVKNGDNNAFGEILRIAEYEFGFPTRELRELKIKMTHDDRDEAALIIIREYLRKKENIAFKKNSGVANSVLSKFLSAQVRTGKENLEKIAAAVGLNETETQKFLGLCPALYYDITYALAKATAYHIEETEVQIKGTGFNNFGEYAMLEKPLNSFCLKCFKNKDKEDSDTEKAWKDEQKKKIRKKLKENNDENADAEESVLRTKQDTLLKLVAGFGIGEDDAKAFLGIAGSRFVTVCDLAFLVAITRGYELLGRRHPLDVFYIVDFLSNGEMGYVDQAVADKETHEKYDKFKGYGFAVPY